MRGALVSQVNRAPETRPTLATAITSGGTVRRCLDRSPGRFEGVRTGAGVNWGVETRRLRELGSFESLATTMVGSGTGAGRALSGFRPALGGFGAVRVTS